jgi:hypothetical protein
LGQRGQHRDRLLDAAGEQDDALPDPYQYAGACGCREFPRSEAQLGEAGSIRCRERIRA